jgi:hypothetical protein
MIISSLEQMPCAKNQIAISEPGFRKADARSGGYLAVGNSNSWTELELCANVWRLL